MKKTSTTKISTLPILGTAIIFSLSALLLASCGGGNGSDASATAKVDSTKASFKIMGTWVSQENPANKVVFTADSLTSIEGDNVPETAPYKWINEQEIEVTNSNTGKKDKAKVTIDGDYLTIYADGNDTKLVREGTAAAKAEPPAGNDPINTNLTTEQKLFKNKLTGTWVENNSYRRVFTNDGRVIFYNLYDTVNLEYQSYYRITGHSTVEWIGGNFKKFSYNMSFSQDNKALVWIGIRGKFPLSYLSANDVVDFSTSIQNNIRSNWVGIDGTASANERLSVYQNVWGTSVNNGNFIPKYYTITTDGTVTANNETYKVSIENDVLTVDQNGVIKKYNRLKEVLD